MPIEICIQCKIMSCFSDFILYTNHSLFYNFTNDTITIPDMNKRDLNVRNGNIGLKLVPYHV